jgi:hypothetical protein
MEDVLDQINPVTAAPQNSEVLRLNIEDAAQRLRKAANWFFIIAALSVVNSLLASRGAYFVMGLALSQLVDGLVSETDGITIFLSSLIFPAVFALFGYFGGKYARWAFIVGGIMYIIDAAIYGFANEWLALAFHLYVTYKLFMGFRSVQEYGSLQAQLG